MKNTSTTHFLRQLALTLLVALLTATTAWAQDFSGSGTAETPYLIQSAKDWNTLANNVSNDNQYNGIYFKLTTDISVTTKVGNASKSFCGTFDGGGHTLTINLDMNMTYLAPFGRVSNATIKNLHTAGTITTSNKYASGLIGHAEGSVTIISCRSSVTINGKVNGDGTHAGFIGVVNDKTTNTITIENCVFDGEFIGAQTTCWGGFIGWTNGTTNIKNCLFDPNKVEIATDGCENFSRNGCTISDSYYTSSLLSTSTQGTDASSMTVEAIASALGSNFEVKNGKIVPKLPATSHYADELTIEGFETVYWTTNPTIFTAVKYGETTLEQDKDYTVEYTDRDGNVISSITAPDQYTLKITGIGDYVGTVTKDFEVAIVEVPTANDLTYTGEEQDLVAAGSVTGGTMMYSLNQDGEYTTNIPKGINAGTYKVYY